MKPLNLEERNWWKFLEEDLRELIYESFLLVKIFESKKNETEKFHDYSFAVFPAAKAYEGFLKKVFLDLKFISQNDYYGSRFRIGKALNPSLEKKYREESVYDKLVEFSGNRKLADTLWVTWKDSRNMLFHWFPDEKRAISLKEAEIKIEQIIKAIDEAYKAYNVKK